MLSGINQNYQTPLRQDTKPVPSPSVTKRGDLDAIENSVEALTKSINDIKSWHFLTDQKGCIPKLEEKLERIKVKLSRNKIELSRKKIEEFVCRDRSEGLDIISPEGNTFAGLLKEIDALNLGLDTFKKESFKTWDVDIGQRIHLLKEAHFINLDIDIDNLRVLEAQNSNIEQEQPEYKEKKDELWRRVDQLAAYFGPEQGCNSYNGFREIAQLCTYIYTLHQKSINDKKTFM
jgi:hypothetical protein